MTNFVNEYRYGIYRWSRSLPLGAAATLQHWQRVKKVIYNFEKETLPNDELPFLKEMRKQKWSLVRSNENLIVFLFIVQSHIMTAGEEEEVNKELELPHLPDMLFIHNRLRCSHASGFQIEVQHFLKDFFCLRGRFPSLPWVVCYIMTQWACSASGSLWEMPDSNPGLLAQKSGALPMSHHIFRGGGVVVQHSLSHQTSWHAVRLIRNFWPSTEFDLKL